MNSLGNFQSTDCIYYGFPQSYKMFPQVEKYFLTLSWYGGGGGGGGGGSSGMFYMFQPAVHIRRPRRLDDASQYTGHVTPPCPWGCMCPCRAIFYMLTLMHVWRGTDRGGGAYAKPILFRVG